MNLCKSIEELLQTGAKTQTELVSILGAETRKVYIALRNLIYQRRVKYVNQAAAEIRYALAAPELRGRKKKPPKAKSTPGSGVIAPPPYARGYRWVL